MRFAAASVTSIGALNVRRLRPISSDAIAEKNLLDTGLDRFFKDCVGENITSATNGDEKRKLELRGDDDDDADDDNREL